VHLLAELLDNAAAFSPPAAPVVVTGAADGDGYRIEVTDRGLGMTGQELAWANQRLAGDAAPEAEGSGEPEGVPRRTGATRRPVTGSGCRSWPAWPAAAGSRSGSAPLPRAASPPPCASPRRSSRPATRLRPRGADAAGAVAALGRGQGAT
jgi:hypothetical protein